MTFASAVLLLFLVIDPFGNVPFFVAALERVPPDRHRRVVLRELLFALAVMVAFLFLGRPLLALLGISEPALSIAGGVILFLIALRMVFPPPGRGTPDDATTEPFLVPLAIPYVAGPSVLATELLFMSREPDRWPTWLAALVVAWLATAIIVLSGSALASRIGRRGLIAIERLMGMLLVVLSVQMLLDGLDAYRAQG